MKRFLMLAMLAPLAWTPAASGDTLKLENGVTIHGEVTELPNGTIQVKVGDRIVNYRSREIRTVTRNNKTGAFNRDAAMARWEQRNAELLERTGLDAETRRRVKKLIYQLQTDDTNLRQRVREQLIAMHREQDIWPFVSLCYGDTSFRIRPNLLPLLVELNARRTQPLVLEEAFHPHAGTRAAAVNLLGRMGRPEDVPLAARGLVDHDLEVRVAAAYALANLNATQASPALMELLGDPELRAQNAARTALQALWKDELGERRPYTASEWDAVWQDVGGRLAGTFALAQLQPLIAEHEEFEDE